MVGTTRMVVGVLLVIVGIVTLVFLIGLLPLILGIVLIYWGHEAQVQERREQAFRQQPAQYAALRSPPMVAGPVPPAAPPPAFRPPVAGPAAPASVPTAAGPVLPPPPPPPPQAGRTLPTPAPPPPPATGVPHPPSVPSAAVAPPPPPPPATGAASPPVTGVASETAGSTPGRGGRGGAVPGPAALPSWPLTPLTTVETSETAKVYRMAGASGLERERMLIVSPDAGGSLAGTYGLAGAQMWRLTRSEGEQYVSPADPDRLGDLIVRHLERNSGRAVVLVGLDKIADASGLRVATRLLDVAREAAESNKGTVLVALNPMIFKDSELRQLEESSTVVRLPS